MKCPKCGGEIVFFPYHADKEKIDFSVNSYYCSKCYEKYTERYIKDIQDAEKIEEDMVIWREFCLLPCRKIR